MSHQVSVRSAVFESLQYILSPDKTARESGEEKLKALEVTEGEKEHYTDSSVMYVPSLARSRPYFFLV